MDSFAYAGYTTNPNFDSLLAKLIVHSPSADFAAAVTRAYRALCEFRIEGVATNIGFLQSLLRHPDFAANRLYTRFVEEHIAELGRRARIPLIASSFLPSRARRGRIVADCAAPSGRRAPGARQLAGAKIDSIDPLAVLSHGKSAANSTPAATVVTAENDAATAHEITGPENTVAVAAPMQGTIVSIDVREGELVRKGQQLFVMEAMKMEHVIRAHMSGVVRQIAVAERDAIFEGHPLAFIEEAEVEIGRGRRGRKGRPRPHPPRSRGGVRAPRERTRRRAARGRRAPAQDPSAHRPREHRGSLRPRQPSSSTARWCLRRSAGAARSTT